MVFLAAFLLLLMPTAMGLGPAGRLLPPRLAPSSLAFAPALGLAGMAHLLTLASGLGFPLGTAAVPLVAVLLLGGLVGARGGPALPDRREALALLAVAALGLGAGGGGALEVQGGRLQTLTRGCYDHPLYAAAAERLVEVPLDAARTRGPDPALHPGREISLTILQAHVRLAPAMTLGGFMAVFGLDSWASLGIYQAMLVAILGLTTYGLARTVLALDRGPALAAAALTLLHPLTQMAAGHGAVSQLHGLPFLFLGLALAGEALEAESHRGRSALAAAFVLGAGVSSFRELLPLVLAGLVGSVVAGSVRSGGARAVPGAGLALAILGGALLLAPLTLERMVEEAVRRLDLDPSAGRGGFPLVPGYPGPAEVLGRIEDTGDPTRPLRALAVLGLVGVGLVRSRDRGWIGGLFLGFLALLCLALLRDYPYLHHKVFGMQLPLTLPLLVAGFARVRESLPAAGPGRLLVGGAALGLVGHGLTGSWRELATFASTGQPVTAITREWRRAVRRDPTLTRLGFPAGSISRWDGIWLAIWMRHRELRFADEMFYWEGVTPLLPPGVPGWRPAARGPHGLAVPPAP